MHESSDNPTDQAQSLPWSTDYAPPDYYDPVIEAYKKDVDRTLLRENLKLTVEQRIRKAQALHASVNAWRAAGKCLKART